MKKKRILSLCIAAALTLGLTPCAGAEAATPDEEGYVTIHLTQDMVRTDGTIDLDLSPMSEALLAQKWEPGGSGTWMPGDVSTGKLRIINDLPYEVTFHGWSAYVPDYGVEASDKTATTGTGATGWDGNVIPLGLNVFRTVSPVIVSFYKAFYHSSSVTITLMDLLLLEKNITSYYKDSATPITTYCELIEQYFGVTSLDELTPEQATKLFGGNRTVRYVKNPDKYGDFDDDDEIFRYVVGSPSSCAAREMDKAVIELGYNYYFRTLMGFSFDSSLGRLNALKKDGLAGFEISKYADPESEIYKKTEAYLNGVTLQPADNASESDTVRFDSVQLAINFWYMSNAYACLDVPNMLAMKLHLQAKLPGSIAGTVFSDLVRDDILGDGDLSLAGSTVRLLEETENEAGEKIWDIAPDIAPVVTEADGAYRFDGLPAGASYRVLATRPDSVNRYCAYAYTDRQTAGNRFVHTNNSYETEPIAVVGGQTAIANAGFYFYSSGGNLPQPTPTPSPKPELEKKDHFAYIIGYPTGNIRPEAQIDREEVATIFFRLLTDASRTAYWRSTNTFSDVFAAHWSNNAISTMENAKVVTGYPDGAFRPDQAITRAEFAVMAARFDSSSYTGENRFPEISGHWAADEINRAAARGWIEGYPDGTFRPDQAITRAEAMTLINNVLDRHADAAQLLGNMTHWPDNAITSWYYAAVQEATNSHYYTREAGDACETWTALRNTRDWAALEKENANNGSSESPGDVMK